VSIYRIAGKFGKFTCFEQLARKVWQMNRFSQKIIIVSRNLDGFSLANQGWFTNFLLSKVSCYMVIECVYVFVILMYGWSLKNRTKMCLNHQFTIVSRAFMFLYTVTVINVDMVTTTLSNCILWPNLHKLMTIMKCIILTPWPVFKHSVTKW